MHVFPTILLSLCAGALAALAPDTDLSKREGGHTGWIASYAADDHTCSNDYILTNGVDDNEHRPTLVNAADPGAFLVVNFTKAEGTDNVGIYFGSGMNVMRAVSFWQGTWTKDGLKETNWTKPNDKYPGACISASAYGWPVSYCIFGILHVRESGLTMILFSGRV